MNSHFATSFYRFQDGAHAWTWLNRQEPYGRFWRLLLPRCQKALGLASASKAFREIKVLQPFEELVPITVMKLFVLHHRRCLHQRGGISGKTLNAAGVLQVPLAILSGMTVYGISVPPPVSRRQRGSIFRSPERFFRKKRRHQRASIFIRSRAWDYAGMCEAFEAGIRSVRSDTYSRPFPCRKK